MTSEEEIEEILCEASAYGLRTEVMDSANKEMEENPNLSKVSAYQIAFNEWVK